MNSIRLLAVRFGRDDAGATMVEYAVMVALIAGVCLLVITSIGNKANATFGTAGNAQQ